MTPLPGVPAEGLLGRTLYDISQILESADGAEERIRRVLHLLRDLVPYKQCAMLEGALGLEPRVLVVPERSPDERATLTARLVEIFGQLVGAGAPPAGTTAVAPRGVHLAVPLIGLDEVIGLLLVESSEGELGEEHLRALSVVAAKLAAYLTLLRARAELVELARERGDARRAAEAANQAKDEFLALVSHELKTPLGSILTSAQSLRSTIDDAAARSRAIDELERSVQAQAKLVDGILNVASVASAALRLNLRVVEPAGLIKDAIESLRLEAERKSIKLESDLEPAAMPLVLDPERIGQVVSILVAHAIDFTPAGGRVEVRLERASGYARIQVRDRGSGGSAQVLAGSPKPAGSGVPTEGALGMVKELVELHGGRVRAASVGEEKSTTFTVELPRVPEVRAVPGLLPAGPRADGQLAGIRVLLLDHDYSLREALQSVLEDYGAKVTAVGSAPEALAILERSRPDVVLFGDLAMRGEGVYDVIRDVTARSRPLPVASLSGWRLEEQERELAAGFQTHLTKPVAIGALVDAIVDLAARMRPI